MILSAATSALATEAALGYSLDISDSFFYILGFASFLGFVIFFCVALVRYFKYLRSKDPEA